jgi:hypothetical protein
MFTAPPCDGGQFEGSTSPTERFWEILLCCNGKLISVEDFIYKFNMKWSYLKLLSNKHFLAKYSAILSVF